MFLLFVTFSTKLAKRDRPTVLFMLLRVLLSVFYALLPGRFFVFYLRAVFSTPTRSRGRRDDMAGSSSSIDHRDQIPYHVEQYIKVYGTYLDVHRFVTSLLVGNTKVICDVRTGRMCDVTVEAWIKRWYRWGGRGAAGSLCHSWETKVRSLDIESLLDTSEALTTYWGN